LFFDVKVAPVVVKRILLADLFAVGRARLKTDYFSEGW